MEEGVTVTVLFEKVMEDLISGALTIESACEILAKETRAEPQRTRFWAQRLEAEIARGRIAMSSGRALFDALDYGQSDRTLWLEAEALVPRLARVATAPTSANAQQSAERELPHQITDIEQMRATLFDPIAKPAAAAHLPPSSSCNDPPAQPSSAPIGLLDTLVPGTVIKDRYRLAAHLGLGGVGQLFDAIDLRCSGNSERRVTLKVVAVNLRHQPHAFAALEIAARRSQPLVHPNIAALHDIDRDGDRVFIIMEPLRGRWLSQLIREARGKGLAYEVAWPIVSGIAQGLAHAHQQGVLHNDLSPHSVFLCEDGAPKIMGFGLLHAAPISNESLDVLDTLTLRAYSEAYTADPWTRLSTPLAADDLYPLGVMAYEMLTGVHPFQRHSLTQARQQALTYQRIPGLNRRAHKLIDRCLSFEREQRPSDAGGFIRSMRPNALQRMFLRTA